jgi:hypothetical protein
MSVDKPQIHWDVLESCSEPLSPGSRDAAADSWLALGLGEYLLDETGESESCDACDSYERLCRVQANTERGGTVGTVLRHEDSNRPPVQIPACRATALGSYLGSSSKALIGAGMNNTGCGNPSRDEVMHTPPVEAPALAASPKRFIPRHSYRLSKRAQGMDIGGYAIMRINVYLYYTIVQAILKKALWIASLMICVSSLRC